MLEWPRLRREDGTADSAVAWAAITLGWFFLLRAGEFVGVDGSPWQLERVVTGADLQPRRARLPVDTFAEADEKIVHIQGSKTDQYNEATIRNQYTSGHAVDHIKVLQRLQTHFPERWLSEQHRPLFRFTSGRML